MSSICLLYRGFLSRAAAVARQIVQNRPFPHFMPDFSQNNIIHNVGFVPGDTIGVPLADFMILIYFCFAPPDSPLPR